MKKNYLTICLGAFIIIASVLLFPVTAHSQDLTEEEKKERCQNNKNRIAELEQQLQVLDAELFQAWTQKEIDTAKKHILFLKRRQAKVDLQVPDKSDADNREFHEQMIIWAKYNFKLSDCIANCSGELANLLAKKIDKAYSLDRPALLAKKNETEKQLAAHRNNLVALGCDAPKKDDGSFDSKLSGYWELELGSPYGGTTQLTVANGGVSGSSQRSATAVIKITGGSFDPATKRLSFTYIQQWSQRTGKASFEFRESSANYVLTGIWRDDVSGSGNWVMTKKKQ